MGGEERDARGGSRLGGLEEEGEEGEGWD